MAKNSIRDYSATNSSNTDIQSIDISEGCSPAGINNAIREVMADLKDVSTGAVALESPAADSLTVTGAFTSQGIDDNATSTAMTLDASGNLLVGTTSPDDSTDGFKVKNGGEKLTVTRDGAEPLVLNRRTSDGDIVRFRKDNTTVGSIGVLTDRIYLAGANEGIAIDDDLNAVIPSEETGAARDNASDLGSSGARWRNIYLSGGVQNLGGASRTVSIFGTDSGSNTRGIVVGDGKVYPNADASLQLGQSANRYTDLYLSGGVYLGGTGSANKLDDYEEGTWTPTHGGNTMTQTNADASYVKVGKLVTIVADVTSAAGSSTTNVIGGLPFTPAYPHGSAHVSYASSSSGVAGGYVSGSSNEINFTQNSSTSGASLVAGDRIIFTATYYTNS